MQPKRKELMISIEKDKNNKMKNSLSSQDN